MDDVFYAVWLFISVAHFIAGVYRDNVLLCLVGLCMLIFLILLEMAEIRKEIRKMKNLCRRGDSE